MRKSHIILVASATLGFALPAMAGSQNLIADGGFENPAPPDGGFAVYSPGQAVGPWSVIGSGNVALTSTRYSSRGIRFDAHAGASFMDLTGTCDCGDPSGVAQTVATIPGVTYKLTFWVGNSYIPGAGTTSTVNAYVNSTLLISAENSQGDGFDTQLWRKFSATFTATSGQATIMFLNGDPNGDINNGLDGITLVAGGAPSFTTLYTFTGGTDGSAPHGGLIENSAGLLYGTADSGGVNNFGTVFSFNPGTGTLSTLHAFTGKPDGAEPRERLLAQPNGNLIYGTTQYGGRADAGTVYSLNIANNQSTTLYSFQDGTDGATPGGDLQVDSSGNLNGEVSAGGAYNFGGIFQVNPASETETVPYSFPGGKNGSKPGLITLDSSGLIYGSTGAGGGAKNAGTIFSFNPTNKKKTILYTFQDGADGDSPNGGLALDNSGNLYGTSRLGGVNSFGTLFKFNISTRQLTTLYAFTGGKDGSVPLGGVVLDGDGKLWGVTEKTDRKAGRGTLYSFDTATNTFTTVHNFTGGADGGTPGQFVLVDSSGAVFGTTVVGGSTGFGTIYKYVP
jgi:uncharacterized repeat protein (TIGR03803 family)